MGFDGQLYLKMLREGKKEAAEAYQASFIPEYLYKFIPLETNNDKDRIETLSNNELWFAKADEQNDPYEYCGINIDREQLIERGYDTADIKNFAESLKTPVMCCFTGKCNDNLPMWAHYANNSKGFCVKYKVVDKSLIKKVIYATSRIDDTKIAADFLSAAKTINESKGVVPTESAQLAKYALYLQANYYIKHISWASEEEYRIVMPFIPKQNPSEPGLVFDRKKNGCNYQNENVGLEISAIICGINCSANNKMQLQEIASEIDVPCQQCQKSPTEYTIIENV